MLFDLEVYSDSSHTVLLATSDAVHSQAFVIEGSRFYTTQFHPDLTAADARARYRWFAEKLPPDEAAEVEREIEAFDHEATDTLDLLERFLDMVEHPADSQSDQ